MPKRYHKWKLSPPAKTLKEYFKSNPKHTRYISDYEMDVTTSPFYHPAKRRIVKLQPEKKRYPTGSYRWAKSDLRIVYLPEKKSHIIYTLEANTVGDIGYKKRS